MQLVIAEKPSVARDLARVLGVKPTGRHAFEGREHVITWCVGHLVELDEPASYDQRWKAWRLDTLPMIPKVWKLRAVATGRDQLTPVKSLLVDRRFSEVVNACDAGREGELIFRYVYELAKSRLPIRRLWISSLTDEAVRAGFAALRPGADFDNLANAARCRSEADWLVGLNATRAVTVRHRVGYEKGTLFSIGRVQTPTLGILVERERAIRQFVPRDYFEIKGTFKSPEGAFSGLWASGKISRFSLREAADVVVGRTSAHRAASDPAGPVIERLKQKKTSEPPPLLFDLTSLQRTANRRYGFSANRTLEIAQALYERHKILTYPRTDSRYLSGDMMGELPKMFRALLGVREIAPFAQTLLDHPPRKNRRVFDDTKVADHHAIVPTGKTVRMDGLDRDEARVFDLVARRFLAVFYPDAEFAITEVVVRVGPGTGAGKGERDAGEDTMLATAPPPPDRFGAKGRVRLVAGWQEVAGIGDDEKKGARGRDSQGGKGDGSADDAADEAVLPPLAEGQRLDGAFEAQAKQTKPPPRYTEGTLLGAMETAGRQIEDEELRAAMKDTGLGTPATRAGIIETLLKRTFIAREGKAVRATDTGVALIAALPVATLGSPELTGTWEARLSRIARGEETREAFMRDIAAYVREVIEGVRRSPPDRAMAAPERAGVEAPPKGPAFDVSALACPVCKKGHILKGNRGWGCTRWREGCAFVVWFEIRGKRITEAQLRDLVAKGKTRKAKFADERGREIAGHLVLDPSAARGAGSARVVAD
jgi:DNA topoisomerase-3